MSRSRNRPESNPPLLYDTSVSSRGETSSTSWASTSHNTTNYHRPQQLTSMSYYPESPNPSPPNQKSGYRQQKLYQRHSFQDSSIEVNEPKRTDRRIPSDSGVADAVSRYTSNLYSVGIPTTKTKTQSEPGGMNVDRYSAQINRFATSVDPRVDHRQSLGLSPRKSMSVNKFAAAVKVTENPSPFGNNNKNVISPESDVRQRIRKLQQRQEERQKISTGMNASNEIGKKSYDEYPDPEPEVQASHDGSDVAHLVKQNRQSLRPQYQQLRQQQQQQQKQPQQQTISGKSCDSAIRDEIKPNHQEYARQSVHQRRMEEFQLQQQQENLSRQQHVADSHNDMNGIQTEILQRNQNNAMERQRSKSLPPEKRYRGGRDEHVEGDLVAAVAFQFHDEDRESLADAEVANAVVLRRLQYDDGRIAEIETPSSSSVRELRNKLWSPNEHLNVAVKPSLHETIDDGGRGRLKSTNQSINKFNRHWLHYNGPEMAGHHGQRIARSLSPKQIDERRAIYRESQFLEAQEEQNQYHQHTDSNFNAGAGREQKSMMFKSRYYDAAQRGISCPSQSKDLQSQRKREALPKQGSLNSKDGSDLHASKTTKESASRGIQSSSVLPKDDKNNRYEGNASSQNPRHENSSLEPNDNSQQQRNRQPEGGTTQSASSQGGSSMNEDTVASLIARLGAVQRDDPKQALAQIDAILRAEASRSNSAVGVAVIDAAAALIESFRTDKSSNYNDSSFATKKVDNQRREVSPISNEAKNDSKNSGTPFMLPKQDAYHDEDLDDETTSDDDDSFFDETTVSSITNPSYQIGVENDVKVASTYASGRPRQSNLQASGNPYSKLFSPSREENKMPNRQHTQSPTPGSIHERCEPYSKQENDKDAQLKIEPSISAGSSLLRKIERFVNPSQETAVIDTSHSEEIGSKIRRWDELSTGAIPNTGLAQSDGCYDDTKYERIVTSRESTNRDRSLSPLSKRNHPWDSSFPARFGKVDVHDTSMDNAVGIETTYTTKRGALADAHLSPDQSGTGPIRNLRKERINKEMQQIKGVLSASTYAKTCQLSQNDDTSEVPSLTSWQLKNTNEMSDDFDSAWVSLPTSTFFQPKMTHSDTSKLDPTVPQGLTVNDDEAVADSRKRQGDRIAMFSPKSDSISPPFMLLPSASSLERPLPNATQHRGYLQQKNLSDPITESKHEQSKTASMHASLPVTQPKARGLRGLLKRKGSYVQTNGELGISLSAAGSKLSADHSFSHNNGNSIENMQGSANNFETSVVDSRGRRSASESRSPSRGRAKSLDERRIRNPSIAKKFGRLLRVYDTDKDKTAGF